MSRLSGQAEVRELARHIRRMAMRVRAAADLAQAQGGFSGASSSAAPGGATGDATGDAGGGCPSSGCSSSGRTAGGCASGGCFKPGSAADEDAESAQEQHDSGRGWWVLAQGGVLDEGSFEAREAAREALLERVRRAGILVGENVWVWDLSGRAQLVLTTLPTLERARKLAQRLREKGLAIVVRREMPEGPTRR